MKCHPSSSLHAWMRRIDFPPRNISNAVDGYNALFKSLLRKSASSSGTFLLIALTRVYQPSSIRLRKAVHASHSGEAKKIALGAPSGGDSCSLASSRLPVWPKSRQSARIPLEARTCSADAQASPTVARRKAMTKRTDFTLLRRLIPILNLNWYRCFEEWRADVHEH